VERRVAKSSKADQHDWWLGRRVQSSWESGEVNMYEQWRKIFRPEASLFVGVFFVGLLGFVRPFQKDLAHVVAIPTMGGGRVMHAAHFELGGEMFGRDTIFLTATITPPIRGDIRVRLEGPEPLEYSLSSRNPPGLPLYNGTHPWYRFEGDTIKGVRPGDDLVVVVTVKPPASPGEYELILADTKTQQVYLTVPVLFDRPGETSHEEAAPSSGTWSGAPQEGVESAPEGETETLPTDALEPCH
jgi:hypothetical protein